jgi:biopolymer transport protein TolR
VIDDEPNTLSNNEKGEMFLNKGEKTHEPLSDEEVLRITGSLVRNAPPGKDAMFLVEGDGRANYAAVAKAMTLLQTAGVKKIGFVTDPVDLTPKGKK